MWPLIFLGAFVAAGIVLLVMQASDNDWDILVLIGLIVFLALWATGVLDQPHSIPGAP